MNYKFILTGGMKMLLQERIEELNSGIINILNNKIEVTGFMSEERLLDYYERGYDCRFSVGLYPKEEFDIAYVKDNALFIIQENGKEIKRYKFIPIKKDTVNYKDIDGKTKSKIFTIRQCIYSNQYNYRDNEKSIIFATRSDLESYFINQYGVILNL